MLHSVKQLHGYKMEALDGEIGHVTGFYFDDKDWVIRYLVTDIVSWMPSRKVLVSPFALGNVHAASKQLEIKLPRERIKNSPSIETELPVARQHEREYYRYYNWPTYWNGPGLWGLSSTPIIPSHSESWYEDELVREADSHLRSTQEITGYVIQALDGEVGHIEDFLIDETSWAVRYLVVATGLWRLGRNVLVPPQSIARVFWEQSKMFVQLPRSEVQQEPEFEPTIAGHKSMILAC
jgi:hypothetical protein